MVTYRYKGKQGAALKLDEGKDTLVVRTQRRLPLDQLPLSTRSRQILSGLRSIARFDNVGVEVLHTNSGMPRDEVREAFRKEAAFRFAGRNLVDPKSRAPVLYTENFFIKFADDTSKKDCKNLLRDSGLKARRELDYAHNAWFVSAKEGTGQEVFDIARELLDGHEMVQLCHPELVREMAYRTAFQQQWHLKPTQINGQRINAHAAVEAAWALSEGEGTIIAIIDDGIDMNHEEFVSPNKIIAPRDVTSSSNDPSPHSGDNHGTACAGVACADGRHGASGVAPKAQLMPIRLASGLGSQSEADAFYWAAQFGADVISCSWGPVDGRWWDQNDPMHNQIVPLPDSTRLAIDWAVRNGRNGKGCVITWAAGNGGESVDNDGYASYDKVVSVGASNDHNTHSVYSDHGEALWCMFPSSDFSQDTLTPGIWTTDRTGQDGYNPGDGGLGDNSGHYTNAFGGTSSACPGAAGVAALIIARNPYLRWDQVKDIMKRSCDRIDDTNGNYDAQGHSSHYGFGRLNAKKAAMLALPSQPRYLAIHTAVQDVSIKDLQTAELSIAVADTRPLKSIKIVVDIEHTYIGDLQVQLKSPASMAIAPIMLHDRFGGGTDNIKRTFDAVNTPGLVALLGKSPLGDWTLDVTDTARADTGKIRKFTVEFGL